MPSTRTLQNSINYVRPILKNQPLLVTNMEPAVSMGNIVLQTMLSAPFRWRQNRKNVTFETVAPPGVGSPVTDYTTDTSDFGFFEDKWIIDSKGNAMELSGAVSLPVVSSIGRPTEISPQYDDNEGNITWRLKLAPDAIYTVSIDYQAKPFIITSPASPWGNVSDEFQFVYDHGFLCLCALLIDDSRFPIFESWFISRLLGVQDGLDDQERLIFLANWQQLVATLNRSSAAVQSGVAGRSK